jgi:hypothetical protein
MFLVWVVHHGSLPPVTDTSFKYPETPNIVEALCHVGLSVRPSALIAALCMNDFFY